jgi:PAS domain S-box-containing protein
MEPRSVAMRYGVAVLAVAMASVVRALVDPVLGDYQPFAFFFVAIAIAASVGGIGPALLAIVLGYLVGDWLFTSPRHELSLLTFEPRVVVGCFAFVSVGLMIAGITTGMRAAESRARERERDLAREVADRAAAEQAERDSQARLAGIIASATDAIITIDAEHRVTMFNAAAEAMFGCSAEAVIGGTLDRFIPERFRAKHPDHIRAFGATGISTRQMGGERVLAALRASGEEFPMEARISQIEVGGEKLYTVIIRDITLRKRAEAERDELLVRERAARAEAETANRAKDSFLAMISHELRTPLSPILAWSRMLRQGKVDEEKTRRALDVIERSARTQAQLIEDMLDVSRIISGKLRMQVRPVPIQPVIENAVETVRPAAEAKNVRLHVVLDTDVGPVLGDAERLQQVVWNLLSNAVKFTPKGGRVQVALERVNSHVEIAVADNGQGIRPETLPFIFERFRQGETGTTRTHGGLGLGLAIVKHILEAHGGTIHAESAGEGKGAVFTVKLPLAVARTADEPERRHPTAVEANGRVDDRYPSLEGVRVLVVDDEPHSNEVVSTLLGSCGAEIRVAVSAAQARELLGRWTADVLVSDIGMPGEDGYEFIAKLRAQAGPVAQIPAVALTAYASRDDRIGLLSAGFQAHVPKPLDPLELVTVVANLARTVGRVSA